MTKIWCTRTMGRAGVKSYTEIIKKIDDDYEVHYEPYSNDSPFSSIDMAKGWTLDLEHRFKRPDLEAVWEPNVPAIIWRKKLLDNEHYIHQLGHIDSFG